MQVLPELKCQVHFERMNLMEDSYPLETFDLVLLRNVLIYFKLVEKEKFSVEFLGNWLPMAAT